VVIYCTGYRITFPFLDDEVLNSEDNRVPLFRQVASLDYPGLYVVGLVQPLGAIMPLAEAQSEWVTDLIEGSGSLPDRATMTREVAIDQAKMKRRYVNSKRHTIQVDFEDYLRTLSAERERSRERATTTAG
jgi:dimethylaniline monooxygenase (N-oxide forming)